MRRRWLPWKTRAQLRGVIRLMTIELEMRDQALAEALRRADDLASQVRRLQGGTGANAPSSQKPDFVLVGIPRPGAGVRLWASRELAGTSFDMTAMDDPPPRWMIRAVMAQALAIDKPTYPEAMAQMATIWRNWDADRATTSARSQGTVRGQITPGQGSLPAGGSDGKEQETGRARGGPAHEGD
jgi:hypothetical protein